MTDQHVYDVLLLPAWTVGNNRALFQLLTDALNDCGGSMPCMLCDQELGPGLGRAPFIVLTRGPENGAISLLCWECTAGYDFPDLQQLVFDRIKRNLLPDARQVYVHDKEGHA